MAGCLQYTKTKMRNTGAQYESEIKVGDAWLYPDRTELSKVQGGDGSNGVAVFKYKESAHKSDGQWAYYNPKYPWLEAVHRYRVPYKWVFEWDYARMVIPARKGSGTYMVHMLWRGYRDVLDVDVLPGPAKSIYGAPSSVITYARTDHCQYTNRNIHGKDYNYTVWNNKKKKTCYVVPPGGSVDECIKHASSFRGGKYGKYGAGVNVVPLYQPEGVQFPGETPNIPFQGPGYGLGRCIGSNRGSCTRTAAASCSLGDGTNHLSSLPNGTLICYALSLPPASENLGVSHTVSHDPRDPVFYSTCYKRNTGWVFAGNPPCPKCGGGSGGGAEKRWKYGDKCVSCTDSSKYAGEVVERDEDDDDGGEGPVLMGGNASGSQPVSTSDSSVFYSRLPVTNATLFAATKPQYVVPEWVLAKTCKRCA